MAARIARRTIYPTVLSVGERDPTMLARVINSAVGGKLNVLGEAQFMPTTNETRIDDPRAGPQSFYCFQALTAQAASRVPSIWIKERGTGYVIVGHDMVPGAATDAWVEYMVIG